MIARGFVLLLLSIVPLAPRGAWASYTDYYFPQVPPSTPSFYNIDMYVTWNAAPTDGGVYPAFNFGFVGSSSGGYMGMQLWGTTKPAIFSIWDSACGVHDAVPVGAACHRFGDSRTCQGGSNPGTPCECGTECLGGVCAGEGSGTQCFVSSYPWVLGREYRYRVWALQSTPTGEQWVAAILDTVTGIETQLGVIEVKNLPGYTGRGWLHKSASTFVEYFAPPAACPGSHTQIAWRGPYANAGTYVAGQAVLPFYGCSAEEITGSGRPVVVHDVGGTGQQTNPPGTVLWQYQCGDQIVDPAEQCDVGPNVAGDCCNATCQFEANNTTCNDGNACTATDKCTNGNCAGTCSVGAACTPPCGGTCQASGTSCVCQ